MKVCSCSKPSSLSSTTTKAISGFRIQSYSPQVIQVKEGHPFTLWCKASHWFQSCQFHHDARSCEFEYDYYSPGYLRVNQCSFNQGTQAVNDYNAHRCGIMVGQARAEHSGLWECHMSSYYIENQWTAKSMTVRVIPEPAPAPAPLTQDYDFDYQGDQPQVQETNEVDHGFVIESYSKNIQTRAGEPFEVWCKSSVQFRNCTLFHDGKSCTFEYGELPHAHIRVRDCDWYFKQGLHFTKDYTKGECGIRIAGTDPKRDGGTWSCRLTNIKNDKESDTRKMSFWFQDTFSPFKDGRKTNVIRQDIDTSNPFLSPAIWMTFKPGEVSSEMPLVSPLFLPEQYGNHTDYLAKITSSHVTLMFSRQIDFGASDVSEYYSSEVHRIVLSIEQTPPASWKIQHHLQYSCYYCVSKHLEQASNVTNCEYIESATIYICGMLFIALHRALAFANIKFGVRHGSILGPILYLDVMAGLPKALGIRERLVTYADDVAIWGSHKDPAEVKQRLEVDAEDFASFAAERGLVLNAAKTPLMWVGGRNKKVSPVWVDGVEIGPAGCIDLLGIAQALHGSPPCFCGKCGQGKVHPDRTGSYHCRLGWQSSEKPDLLYKNVMARTRKEKGKESELWVANDILNIEAVRFNLKTPFDRNVVTQFETQETLLDYGFHHLGLSSEEDIKHPIMMTEPLGNPNKCREMMSELLFECYNVPQVGYGVDSLFSFHKNVKSQALPDTALIVSGGFHTIHIIPMIKGEISVQGIRRINVGGFHLTNCLHRGLQLKYSSHVNNITISRSEEILFNQCHLVDEYLPELRKWSDSEYYSRYVRKMQLPFTPNVRATLVDPEIIKQRRQELAKRLVEMNQKKREEKLQADMILMKSLRTAKTLHEQGYDEKVRRILTRFEIAVQDPKKELDQIMDGVRTRIEKAKAALVKKPDGEKEEPVPKKRREEMSGQERDSFDKWMDTIKLDRETLIEKRATRKHRKDQLAKRRTAASQERMRIISQLAKTSKKEDDFGMNDDDWDVYKKISKDAGESDSEEEQDKLLEYETILKENDPSFVAEGEDEVSHDSKEWYQLHIATERIRIPEILFQPSIVGHDQAGISETIQFVLRSFPESLQQDLVNNVFLTGALAQIPGFKSRLETDLREMRPFQSTFAVHIAQDPTLDAWTGAKDFVREEPLDGIFMSRQEYDEKGTECFKEHRCSNKFYKTPEAIVSEEVSQETSARGHPRSDARFSSFKVADAQIRLSDGIPVISDRSTHEILSEILLLATKRIRSLRTP
eukprot:snap_masked-scaffold704_size109063-processed-gene-0.8 protein:Tk10207 transcript:snap_masked-scaffold704_size109063-processed-gene-0.8-mRNA-1 annotation:"actin-related protein 5"